jgi:hypothetical protein
VWRFRVSNARNPRQKRRIAPDHALLRCSGKLHITEPTRNSFGSHGEST